jgi:hypothetical protein
MRSLVEMLAGSAVPGGQHEERMRNQNAVTRSLPARVDPERLDQAGWGLVVRAGQESEVMDQLAPLIAHRRQQAGSLFRTLTYIPGESIEDLRDRWIFSPGVVNPRKVPGYLLVVGGPEEVPFAIEHDLNADLAVGRVAFEVAEDARRYAESVVANEQRPRCARKAAFFATRNPGDLATERSLDQLATPLAAAAGSMGLEVEVTRWFEAAATRAQLGMLLGGPETPAFLFTACHGLVFPCDHPRQRACQGALVTQEWPGPRSGPIDDGARFCASDVGDVDLGGMVALLFSCFGAGTPAVGEYAYKGSGGIRTLTSQPFVAQLPQAMLAKGASAVIAHVERTWDVGFRWEGVGDPQVDTLQSIVEAILDHRRVGHAIHALRQRYTSASAVLAAKLMAEHDHGRAMSPRERAFLWTVTADARGWVVLGDPAVRIVSRPSAIRGGHGAP